MFGAAREPGGIAGFDGELCGPCSQIRRAAPRVHGVTGKRNRVVTQRPVPNQGAAARGRGPLTGEQVKHRLGDIGGRFFSHEVAAGNGGVP